MIITGPNVSSVTSSAEMKKLIRSFSSLRTKFPHFTTSSLRMNVLIFSVMLKTEQ